MENKTKSKRGGARYQTIGVPENFRTFPDKNIHKCNDLALENSSRLIGDDNLIRIFKDFDNKRFNLMVGLEFVKINVCPFCGKRL